MDVGASFSASAVSEDNLVHQLLAAGKRIVRLLCCLLCFCVLLVLQMRPNGGGRDQLLS